MSVARRSRRTAGQSPARVGQGDGFGTAPANDWSSNSATTPASEGDAGAADSSDEDMDSRSQLDKLRAIRAAVGLPFLLVIGTVCKSGCASGPRPLNTHTHREHPSSTVNHELTTHTTG